MILVVNAADNICVGAFAWHVALEDHVRLTKSPIKGLIRRVREEIELALILIGVILGLGYDNGDEDAALILALRALAHVLPLDVVFVAHVDEGTDLILGKDRGNHTLGDGVCSQIHRARFKRAEKCRDHIELQVEPARQIDQQVVAGH